jgi:hypothetical protein
LPWLSELREVNTSSPMVIDAACPNAMGTKFIALRDDKPAREVRVLVHI